MADKKDPKKITGWSGDVIHYGRILDRHKPYSCPQSEWPQLVNEMLRHPAVRTVARAVADTMLSSRFKWRPGDTSVELSVALADQMNKNMGLDGNSGTMRRQFEQIIRQVVLYLWVGFRYMEVDWKFNEETEMWDLYDLRDRRPSAHDRWQFLPVTDTGLPGDQGIASGDLQGAFQKHAHGDTAPADGGQPFISAWHMLIFVNDQEGDDYEGNGLLRALERAYHRYWEAELKIQAFSRARSTVILEVSGDDGQAAVGNSACELPDLFDQVADVRNSAAAFQQGAAQFITTYPGAKIANTLMIDHEPGMALQIRAEAVNEILMLGYVQFLQLGTTDTGSRAVGEVHESFFRRSCINTLDYICSVFNGEWAPGRGLAGQYAYYNAPVEVIDPSLLPVLIHEGLQVDKAYDNLDRIMNAFNSGLLVKTPGDENKIRSLLGLDLNTVQARDGLLEDQSGEEAAEGDVV